MVTLVFHEGVSSLSLWLVWLLLTEDVVLRDVSERGRDIEGVIKQWFSFVKPNFERFVEPQRKDAGKPWRPRDQPTTDGRDRYYRSSWCRKPSSYKCATP